MFKADDWITEASALPLKDAAFGLWIDRVDLDRLEERDPVDVTHPKFAGISRDEALPRVAAERAAFEQQEVRRRLKMTHPRATEAERERAIAAAIKFDRDCFKHWNWSGDFCRAIEEAVRNAARKNPGYRSETLWAAENHVGYYMK